MAFGRAIVERSKPAVERDQTAAVVALKVLVMEIVKIAAAVNFKTIAHFEFLVARMTQSRQKQGELKLKKHVEWM